MKPTYTFRPGFSGLLLLLLLLSPKEDQRILVESKVSLYLNFFVVSWRTIY